MKLLPYTLVDSTPFSATAADICAARGEPLASSRNAVGLNELDYGDVVFRFQDNGRLEEVTTRAPVVYFGKVDIPFAALEAYVQSSDPDAFVRGGFIVSPRHGLAFDPSCPPWVTALAAHCIPTWRAL